MSTVDILKAVVKNTGNKEENGKEVKKEQAAWTIWTIASINKFEWTRSK
jgi:hypothetical protein